VFSKSKIFKFLKRDCGTIPVAEIINGKIDFFSKHQRFLIATESSKYLLIFVLYVCVILCEFGTAISKRYEYPCFCCLFKNLNYPTSTRRHGNFAGVHTLLRIILSSNSAVLINIITGVSPPHFDFFVFYVLCQC
jgi:hypothetical protein